MSPPPNHPRFTTAPPIRSVEATVTLTIGGRVLARVQSFPGDKPGDVAERLLVSFASSRP